MMIWVKVVIVEYWEVLKCRYRKYSKAKPKGLADMVWKEEKERERAKITEDFWAE